MPAKLLQQDPDIYVIEVPDSEMPTNAFAVRQDEDWLLIDTGCDHDECYEYLISSLREIGVKRDHLSVFVTHSHVDHAGLLHRFADCRIIIGESTVRENVMETSDGYISYLVDLLISEGVPRSVAREGADVARRVFTPLDFHVDQLKLLKDYEIFEFGDLRFRAVPLRGHTAGALGLYEGTFGLLFVGDVVLANMTSSIDLFPEGNSGFAEDLFTLHRLKSFPIKSIFFGHFEPMDYGSGCLDTLIERHHKRLDNMYGLVEEFPDNNGCWYSMKQRGYHSFSDGHWLELSSDAKVGQLVLAVRTLHALTNAGMIDRYLSPDGTYRYRPLVIPWLQ